MTFEGYGPHGSALMVTCVTDNRNRTVPDMRHAFSKYGGNMVEPGAVGGQFDRKSYFAFASSEMSFDKAFELGIEAGANDVTRPSRGGYFIREGLGTRGEGIGKTQKVVLTR